MGIKCKDAINVTSRLHNQKVINGNIKIPMSIPENGNAAVLFTVRSIAENTFIRVFGSRF